MQYFVAAALLLLIASFVYPPLGRSMRNVGRKLEDDKRARRIDRRKAVEAPIDSAPPQIAAADPPKSPQQFGKRKSIEEPRRPPHPPVDQLFPQEVFAGKVGEMLRGAGFAPDDPINQGVNVQPVAVLLAEDLKRLKDQTGAVNAVVNGYQLIPWHLLPVGLWRGAHAEFLRRHLDLSPYRPWNTIFLPSNAVGTAALGLPVAPPQPTEPDEQTSAMLAIIHETYAGMNPPEGEAVKLMLAAVRENFATLFPTDPRDFSDRVRQARADVRALAFAVGGVSEIMTKEVIAASHSKFLGRPEEQLLA